MKIRNAMPGPVRFRSAPPPTATLTATSASNSDAASSWWNNRLPDTKRIPRTRTSNAQPRIGLGLSANDPSRQARRIR
jgi:hypothetical protein